MLFKIIAYEQKDTVTSEDIKRFCTNNNCLIEEKLIIEHLIKGRSEIDLQEFTKIITNKNKRVIVSVPK